MVDSSVGGKTAIDLENGKNLAGAFWQPRAVIADVGCLGTLSDEQFADGCGEVVKHAVIADAELFEELERTPLTPDLLRRDLSRVAWLIARNIDIKRAVVEQDEREGGLRKLLNFGHSIGHGIEAAEGYRLGHGTCVGIGMVAIASASVTAELCPEDVPERIARLLTAHGLSLAFQADPGRCIARRFTIKNAPATPSTSWCRAASAPRRSPPTPIEEFHRIPRSGSPAPAPLAEEACQTAPGARDGP